MLAHGSTSRRRASHRPRHSAGIGACAAPCGPPASAFTRRLATPRARVRCSCCATTPTSARPSPHIPDSPARALGQLAGDRHTYLLRRPRAVVATATAWNDCAIRRQQRLHRCYVHRHLRADRATHGRTGRRRARRPVYRRASPRPSPCTSPCPASAGVPRLVAARRRTRSARHGPRRRPRLRAAARRRQLVVLHGRRFGHRPRDSSARARMATTRVTNRRARSRDARRRATSSCSRRHHPASTAAPPPGRWRRSAARVARRGQRPSVALMPDGHGYLVLDNLGGVSKYGSGARGAIGAGARAVLGVDLGRRSCIVTAVSASRSATTCSTPGAACSTPAGFCPHQPVGHAVPRPLARHRHLRRPAVAAAQRRHAAAPTRRPRRRSEDDDRAQHLAALHLVERVLDRVERDGLAHEAVEVEAAREVQVDEHREVA